jgi:Fe-S cluster biosynthesis and repair protein YggX
VLGREAEGLAYAPYPGDLGARIYREISEEGWQRWVNHQTMLINEYRLTPIDPQHRQFLVNEMQKFLFGEGAAHPEGFVPPAR